MEPLTDQVFSIPLILKEILKYLGKEDLLRTSFVSKNWNFFSREVLRESKKCLIIFRGNFACQNLRNLNELILRCQTVPFNGICMRIPWSNAYHRCGRNANLSEWIENILSKINIKNLSIDWQDYSRCLNCECQFVRAIILKNANSLEELCFDYTESFKKCFSQITGLSLVGQWLPNLRILKFPFNLEISDLYHSLFKELVEASPKLQKLYGKIHTRLLKLILPLNLVQAVKELYFVPKIEELNNSLAFAMANPKLEKLWFSTLDQGDGSVNFSEWKEASRNEVSRIVKQILISCQDSLKKVGLHHVDLILVTYQWDIPTLEKVTHLSLIYSEDIDCIGFYSTLRKIEWAKYFPYLKEILVSNRQFHHHTTNFYIPEDFRQSAPQFVCESVTKFCWLGSESFSNALTLRMFEEVFPNVKEFYLKEINQFVSFLYELWTAWSDLEAIYISTDMRTAGENYDSVFLGISEEEAVYSLKNLEDLNSLEIAATKPSILNLQKLKKIVIQIDHDDDDCISNSPISESLFLSRLTGRCAFSRIPGLEVEIIRDVCDKDGNYCEIALNHLKPFVKLVEGKIGDFGVSF